jgi:hypothetical protein
VVKREGLEMERVQEPLLDAFKRHAFRMVTASFNPFEDLDRPDWQDNLQVGISRAPKHEALGDTSGNSKRLNIINIRLGLPE